MAKSEAEMETNRVGLTAKEADCNRQILFLMLPFLGTSFLDLQEVLIRLAGGYGAGSSFLMDFNLFSHLKLSSRLYIV